MVAIYLKDDIFQSFDKNVYKFGDFMKLTMKEISEKHSFEFEFHRGLLIFSLGCTKFSLKFADGTPTLFRVTWENEASRIPYDVVEKLQENGILTDGFDYGVPQVD